MKFAYEDLSDAQFEQLIVLLCQRLLGIAVQGFARGPDGGRDAKFVGTAELHPSTAAPWIGTTIIQAKHTNGVNRSYSESDFFSTTSEKTVIGEEVPRIKTLREAQQLDHYMLFANRRLTAKAQSDIQQYLASRCDLAAASIYLCGLEQLEIWMKRFPEIANEADLDPVDCPLIVSPDDLAEVVLALAAQRDQVHHVLDDPPTTRISYEEKNELNHLTAEYAKEQRRKYLKETATIHAFLAAPENLDLQRRYQSVVDEFQLKIIAKRKDYQTFDDVMEALVNMLFDRDVVLRQHAHKRLTRAVLFYMYWHCDIGEAGDASADETLPS